MRKTHAREAALSTAVERTAYRHRLDAFLASREAGRNLTADSLSKGIKLQAVLDAAAAVAEYADIAIAITQDEYRPRLECQEGCAYCCRKPGVLVTVPELLRVVDYVDATFSDEDRSALTDRARRYRAQIEGRSFNDPTPDSVPCPMLVNERCTAYEIRPLVCRGYNSTSVAACQKAHDNPDSMVPMFAILKDVTDGATVGAAHTLKDAGFSDRMVDLGTGLSIALSAEEGFSESIMQDGTPLRAAEHPTWVAELWTAVCETAREVGVEIEASETRR